MKKWFLNKIRNHCLFFLILSLLAEASQLSAKASWKWQDAPKKASWKEFQKTSLKEREKMWEELKHFKMPFDKLAWQWRLAWVQTCATGNSAWCSEIYQLGLFDKALVVRAETAARLGERFAGTGHRPALKLLNTAYAIQQNSRNNKPLYVQYRILHAIKQIGGAEGLALGERLALNSSHTSRYWHKLALSSPPSKAF